MVMTLVITSSAIASEIVLRSGQTVDGKIIEQTHQYVKIDPGFGVGITYFVNEIDTVDGEKIGIALPSVDRRATPPMPKPQAVMAPAVDLQQEEISGKGIILTPDRVNARIEYFWYVPQASKLHHDFPVLIIVPGLGESGEPYITGRWRDFARQNGFALISPSFKYDYQDWLAQKSYQFLPYWAGETILTALDVIAAKSRINKKSLYLFGFSAGAQYVHRFALWRPDICKAAAFHSPGSIQLPQAWVATKFFVTVGLEDTGRVDFVNQFITAAKNLGINILYKEYPGVGHSLGNEQITESLQFFLKVKNEVHL